MLQINCLRGLSLTEAVRIGEHWAELRYGRGYSRISSSCSRATALAAAADAVVGHAGGNSQKYEDDDSNDDEPPLPKK